MPSVVPIPLALGRFKQLPQRSSEVWQGALVRLPAWVDDPNSVDGSPYRPAGALWVSLRTGHVNLQVAPDGRPASADLALSALFEFATKEAKSAGGRPARIEVRGPELTDALTSTLAGTGTAVINVDDLPAVREVLRHLENAQHERPYPALLDSPGMSVPRVRAFADAAARFYDARPWQHFVNEDLLVVESPGAPKGIACVSVLGNGGQQFGLAFFDSRRAFERMITLRDPRQVRRAFGVTFGPAEDFPFGDVDLWEDHDLPVSGPRAYPLAADITRDRIVRPDPPALTYMEALLRALADTVEADLDSGRWERRVDTFDGPVTLTLSLPALLEADQTNHSNDDVNADSRSPIERAGDLVDAAQDATGRLRIKLARQALSTNPDSVDACVLLGDSASTPDDALQWYRRGVEAGERTLGSERLSRWTGSLWDHVEARPYMHARRLLADELRALGRDADAIAHYQELLRLNPGDDQGVRLQLLPALIESGRDDAVGVLLASYEGDLHAVFPYARALWLFRREGDGTRARSALEEASRVNPHVVKFLLNPDSMPLDQPRYYVLGSKEEAVISADELGDAFDRTKGALEWLRARAPHLRERRKRRSKK